MTIHVARDLLVDWELHSHYWYIRESNLGAETGIDQQ